MLVCAVNASTLKKIPFTNGKKSLKMEMLKILAHPKDKHNILIIQLRF